MSSAPTFPPDVNYWPDRGCARTFWAQRELPPYRRLLTDTVAWLDPAPDERWLDLRCGCGQLTLALWEKSHHSLAEIVALDCADAIGELRPSAQPRADEQHIPFQQDFSTGLGAHPDASFDGVVSGLAIQYAQSYSSERGAWTTEAYDHLLNEVARVLRPGGRFVFSVHVPEPSWLKVALYGAPGFFVARQPLRYFTSSMRMLRYGTWLKREARRGRFHYLPFHVILDKLTSAGFVNLQYRLSFARQAYVFRARRP